MAPGAVGSTRAPVTGARLTGRPAGRAAEVRSTFVPPFRNLGQSAKVSLGIPAHVAVPRIRVSVVVPNHSAGRSDHPHDLTGYDTSDVPVEDRAEDHACECEVERVILIRQVARVSAGEVQLRMSSLRLFDPT